jgi:hypothetical protein
MIKSGARAWMFSQVDRALETTKTEINLLTKKLAAPQVDSTLRARSSGLEGKMSHLVHNEQMKLAANLFNNLAVVSLASGILVPIFSTRTSATPISFSEGGYAIFGGLSINTLGSIFLGLVCCVVFEVVAQSFLAKLEVEGVKTGRTARAFLRESGRTSHACCRRRRHSWPVSTCWRR